MSSEMDFGALLDYAKQNEKPVKEVKCYRTTFAPPKKEQKSKSLSVNIQKFLARKEEEEKQKVVEADKKRDELLALRAQDSKANKRVRAMLKSTKAANKAVIDDARDDVNTAVTMAGPSQPDEDDYGYVSQEASAFYNKLMDKYVSLPSEDPKFSKKSQTVKDLVSTKDRVRMALLKEEEEESMGHKRKRRRAKEESKDKEDDNICFDAPDRGVLKEPRSSSKEIYHEKRPEPVVKKKRPLAPPPMNFADLLKVAAQKQFEPIKIEKKEANEEDERPMTKKQKEEYLREKQYRMRKEEMARMAAAKSKEKPQPSSVPSQVQEEPRASAAPKPPSIPRIPKLNGAKAVPESNSRMYETSEQQIKKKELQHSARDVGQVKQRPPESGKPSSNSRPIPSSREPEGRSNEVRRNSLQQSSKLREPYQEARSSPSQSVPSVKERKVAIEERKPMREPSLPMAKEEKKSSNQMIKPVIKDERSQMKPSSKPTLKDERGLSNSSQKPVIRDERKQPGNSMRPPPKEERRSSLPDNSRVPVKPTKPVSGANSSKYDTPQQRDGGNPKMSSNSMRRVEEKSSRSATIPSGNSLLKDRLTGSNSQGHSPKINPISNPQARKESKVAVPAQRPSNPGAPARQPLPADRPAKTPVNKPQSLGSQGPKSQSLGSQGPKSQSIASQGPKSQSLGSQGPKSQSLGSRGPSRDAPRGPPQGQRREVMGRGDVRRPMMAPDRGGPPGGRFLPPSRPKPQGMRKPAKRRIESDDEYDSELDDFIDDGPEEGEDYSKYIKEIFGYDKSRYKYAAEEEDDDDECMESNFAQQMKEEFVSTKLGLMEDLEDIKKEQMEKQRKKAQMMKKKKVL